jgi:hypothetical protein
MSINPRGNRGGIGWQEPFIRPGMRPANVTELLEAFAQTNDRLQPTGFVRRAPVPEDMIDMIEINGVWMSAADAHAARVKIGRAG